MRLGMKCTMQEYVPSDFTAEAGSATAAVQAQPSPAC